MHDACESATAEAVSRLRLMKTGYGDLVVAEWEPARPETIPPAREEFDRFRSRGGLAFRLNGPGDQVPLTEFDPTAGEILLVPAIQGG